MVICNSLMLAGEKLRKAKIVRANCNVLSVRVNVFESRNIAAIGQELCCCFNARQWVFMHLIKYFDHALLGVLCETIRKWLLVKNDSYVLGMK